jgi:hypothetical protein
VHHFSARNSIGNKSAAPRSAFDTARWRRLICPTASTRKLRGGENFLWLRKTIIS